MFVLVNQGRLSLLNEALYKNALISNPLEVHMVLVARCARVELNHNGIIDSREYILIYYYITPLCLSQCIARRAYTHNISLIRLAHSSLLVREYTPRWSNTAVLCTWVDLTYILNLDYCTAMYHYYNIINILINYHY